MNQLKSASPLIAAGSAMTATLTVLAILWQWLPTAARWPVLLCVWFVLGVAYAALVTPGGRLLRRSSHERDRPALFAAQFSLSHLCWLLTYPLAGWFGAKASMVGALWSLVLLATLGGTLGVRFWPARDDEVLAHTHEDLSSDHPHLASAAQTMGGHHAHAYVIDELHTRWPT